MNYPQILKEIYEEIQPYAKTGEPASYIPELLKVNPDRYGICLRTIEGKEFALGDSDERFAVQSISKVFSLAMSFGRVGNELWKRIGVEPSGNAFNSIFLIDTNVKALLAMTRLVVPGMVERGRGHVINMGSIAGDYAYPGGSVYCACKAAVKALSDGLRIDLVDTPIRVTNIKPGLVETNFSVVRFRGNREAADNVYKGIRPLTGDDIAEVVYFAAAVPEHIQIAEVLVMPANQATGTIVSRK